jgi:hypothetical protein
MSPSGHAADLRPQDFFSPTRTLRPEMWIDRSVEAKLSSRFLNAISRVPGGSSSSTETLGRERQLLLNTLVETVKSDMYRCSAAVT